MSERTFIPFYISSLPINVDLVKALSRVDPIFPSGNALTIISLYTDIPLLSELSIIINSLPKLAAWEIAVSFSAETLKAYNSFINGVKDDVSNVLGLNGGE